MQGRPSGGRNTSQSATFKVGTFQCGNNTKQHQETRRHKWLFKGARKRLWEIHNRLKINSISFQISQMNHQFVTSVELTSPQGRLWGPRRSQGFQGGFYCHHCNPLARRTLFCAGQSLHFNHYRMEEASSTSSTSDRHKRPEENFVPTIRLTMQDFLVWFNTQ